MRRTQRRRLLPTLIAEGIRVREIAHRFDVTPATIYNDLRYLGLPTKRRHRSGSEKGDNAVAPNPHRYDKAAQIKERRAAASRGKVRDRRRFKTSAVAMGKPSKIAPADVCDEGRTLFPSRVFEPTDAERVFKDGCNNSKIGGDVLVGRLKGAKIFTLTLEERATCPRSCDEWRSCYGNAMQHARRWSHGPALEARIKEEIQYLCRVHEKVLVRLHVLGDFYSLEYASLWAWAMSAQNNLTVFGFTAWKPGTEMGDAISGIRDTYPDRFMVRHSGQTGPWGAFTLPFPTHAARIGDAVVCPEQRHAIDNPDRRTHCGNCGVCWQTQLPIAFILH